MSTKYILSELTERFNKNYGSNPKIKFTNTDNLTISINLNRLVLINIATVSDNPDILKVDIVTLKGENWVGSSRVYSLKRFPTKRKYTRVDYILNDLLTTLNVFSEDERDAITNFITRIK